MPVFEDPPPLPPLLPTPSFSQAPPVMHSSPPTPQQDHREAAESEDDEEIISYEEDDENDSKADDKNGGNNNSCGSNCGGNYNNNDNHGNTNYANEDNGKSDNNYGNQGMTSTPKPSGYETLNTGQKANSYYQGNSNSETSSYSNGNSGSDSRGSGGSNSYKGSSSQSDYGQSNNEEKKKSEGDEKDYSGMMMKMMEQLSSMTDGDSEIGEYLKSVGVMKKKKNTPCEINEMNQMMMIQMMQMMLKMKFKDDSVKEAHNMKSLWTSILSRELNSPSSCKSCPPCSLMSGISPSSGHYGEIMKSSVSPTITTHSNIPNVVYEMEKYPPPRIDLRNTKPSSITEIDMVSLPFAPGKFLPPHPVMMASTDSPFEPEEESSSISLPDLPHRRDFQEKEIKEFKEHKKLPKKSGDKKVTLKSTLEGNLKNLEDPSPHELVMKSNIPRDRSFKNPNNLQTYSDSYKIEVIETAESTQRKGILELTELTKSPVVL
jgi:hypothetical protein